HYQPKATRVAPGRWVVEGVEALARWEHASLGFVSPTRFIPLAEKSNLIRRLTEQVLEIALSQCRAWDAVGLPLSVAVNLSPQLLNDLSFPDQVARMAAQVGADARRIIFEVTESAAMFDPGTTMDVLTHAREELRAVDRRLRHRLLLAQAALSHAVQRAQDRHLLRARRVRPR